MLKARHEFIKDATAHTIGEGYATFNKNNDTIMVISATSEDATGCTLTFLGKVTTSDVWVPITAFKSSNYDLVETGSLNQAYIIDCASWAAINVEVDGISGGKVTVVGEVIE